MSEESRPIRIAFLGSDESSERDLPQALGAVARAARAAKTGLAAYGFGDIEIWPPGKFPLLGIECASLAAAALEAVEPIELRRCPIVRKLIDNAVAYHAHLYWVQQAREESERAEHARKVQQRTQAGKERAA